MNSAYGFASKITKYYRKNGVYLV